MTSLATFANRLVDTLPAEWWTGDIIALWDIIAFEATKRFALLDRHGAVVVLQPKSA